MIGRPLKSVGFFCTCNYCEASRPMTWSLLYYSIMLCIKLRMTDHITPTLAQWGSMSPTTLLCGSRPVPVLPSEPNPFFKPPIHVLRRKRDQSRPRSFRPSTRAAGRPENALVLPRPLPLPLPSGLVPPWLGSPVRSNQRKR